VRKNKQEKLKLDLNRFIYTMGKKAVVFHNPHLSRICFIFWQAIFVSAILENVLEKNVGILNV
jgi:hypothetical protein